jgi:hypothetical protein
MMTEYVDVQFLIKVSITCLVCWAPVNLFNAIMARCDPNEEQKINS